jgi:hypothetical protein
MKERKLHYSKNTNPVKEHTKSHCPVQSTFFRKTGYLNKDSRGPTISPMTFFDGSLICYWHMLFNSSFTGVLDSNTLEPKYFEVLLYK